MDVKTFRAAALAAAVTLLVLWGLGVFLGFAAVPSLIVGAVSGTMAFALIALASKRAETFSPTDPTD
ncbi:MAG: fatty acid desaturase [Glaciecola sp.]|jgi:fatty acid desaturase